VGFEGVAEKSVKETAILIAICQDVAVHVW